MNQFENDKWREPDKQLTPEQQEENRRKLTETSRFHDALSKILIAKTLDEARDLARAALYRVVR